MAGDGVVVVTGGAGFVGGAVARYLQQRGMGVVVLDRRPPTYDAKGWIRAGVGDAAAWRAIDQALGIRAVIHCAGLIVAPQSVEQPAAYFEANVAQSLAMLQALAAIPRPLPVVFSSSAAVYGNADRLPIPEEAPCRPTTPYGLSKWQVEQALPWFEQAYGLRWMALRYFNAAGATDGQPEAHVPETHLIPRILQAVRRQQPVPIYGADFKTPDGTAIRDYVHVADLARAHAAALEYLESGGASAVLNLGSGCGHSVAEVVAAVARVTGRPVLRQVEPRRRGDPPALVADIQRAQGLLGWRPQCSDLERVVQDAYRAAAAAP